MATLKIEDLTIGLASFDNSIRSTLDQGSSVPLTARNEQPKSGTALPKTVKRERPTSSCSNDPKPRLAGLAEKKQVQ